MTAPTPTPLDLLLPYQRKWVDDPARFKIGCMARQTARTSPPPPKSSATA